jgi:tRNA pseudouridine38-40 synthase
VLPQGSGRTDAGVHALAQVASFQIDAVIPQPNLQRALNSVLPPSIRILSAEPAAEDFHARRSAARKTYEYRIFERVARQDAPNLGERICSPFLAPYVWDCRWALDFDRLQAAASVLVGEHDFASFAASDPDRTMRSESAGEPVSTVRTLFASAWRRSEETLIYRVTGTGFLHHMVRNIVGTLADVGRGTLAPADIVRILSSRDRCAAGPTAPAQGLFLVVVEYAEFAEAPL